MGPGDLDPLLKIPKAKAVEGLAGLAEQGAWVLRSYSSRASDEDVRKTEWFVAVDLFLRRAFSDRTVAEKFENKDRFIEGFYSHSRQGSRPYEIQEVQGKLRYLNTLKASLEGKV